MIIQVADILKEHIMNTILDMKNILVNFQNMLIAKIAH